jgi:DNA repair exonuclease SbcCD ATPase subunit
MSVTELNNEGRNKLAQQLQEREKNVQNELNVYYESNLEYQKEFNEFRAAESKALKKLQELYKGVEQTTGTKTQVDSTVESEYKKEVEKVDSMRNNVFELQRNTLLKLEQVNRSHVSLLLDLLSGYKNRVEELEKQLQNRSNNV